MALDSQLTCYSWFTGISEVAMAVVVRKRRPSKTAALMLGSDRSRGYCLEMICADFLAGAEPYRRRLDSEGAGSLAGASMPQEKAKRERFDAEQSAKRRLEVLERDSWRCQVCGGRRNLEVHHILYRSRQGSDAEENLVTLCASCHHSVHVAPR